VYTIKPATLSGARVKVDGSGTTAAPEKLESSKVKSFATMTVFRSMIVILATLLVPEFQLAENCAHWPS
jgi:hypothetical protein